MLKSFTLLSLSFCFFQFGFGQGKPAYILYTGKGRAVSYESMIKSFKKTEVVLFGEYHDNPIAHWLEYEVTHDLQRNYKLTLGAEMMETDNQIALNDYLAGNIDQKGFDTIARLWNNYKTDYKPLVDFAKDSSLKFIATNVPRRYARMVNKGGFEAIDTLSAADKNWIAPLPIVFDPNLSRYKNMMDMMGDHGTPNIIKAQAIKDATMAHQILQNVPAKKLFKKGGKEKFIHYNGAYHSDFHEGIAWYLIQKNKNLNVKTISTVSADNPTKFNKEDIGRADFIIYVDSDMTKTY